MNRLVAITACATMLIAGCASTIARLKGPDANLKYADYAGAPIDSFWRSTFDGWAPVEKDQLVMRSDFDKAYLITVAPFCPNLLFAQRIAITSMGGSMDKFDKIEVDHVRCLIRQIQPVDMKKMDADRKALRDHAAPRTPPATSK